MIEEKDNLVKNPVILGFLEPCNSNLSRSSFPSKVGGKPAWLNPLDLPSDLTCSQCGLSLRFLLQLYAPLDEKNQCFHRMIMVFICVNKSCLCHEGSIKVFRCQLPSENTFYQLEHPVQSLEIPDALVPLCVVCGNPSKKKCGECHSVHYCGKTCQKHDWKNGHQSKCNQINTHIKHDILSSSFLFPQYEIMIEDEILDDHQNDYSKEKSLYDSYQQETQNNEIDEKDCEDMCEDFQQFTKEKYNISHDDIQFENFQQIVSFNPSQVIRYDRQGSPLWVYTDHQISPKDILPCPLCHSNRSFEFQILPQMLYYLNIDNGHDDIDWGTIAIYTCDESCSQDGLYHEEFSFLQPSL